MFTMACGGGAPAPATTGGIESPIDTVDSSATTAGGPGAPDSAEAPSAPALPPPRPTTLPLAEGGSDDRVDKLLLEGDAALERGTRRRVQVVRGGARGRASGVQPIVGVARARIWRTDVPADFGAGKGNAEILQAVKDLRRAVDGPSLGRRRWS